MNHEEALKFHGADAPDGNDLAAIGRGRKQESHASGCGGKSDPLPSRH